ncbi:MAG: proton-conducting transporter membrane subunit [Myxococcota bacterium]
MNIQKEIAFSRFITGIFAAYFLAALSLLGLWVLSSGKSLRFFGLYLDLNGVVFLTLIAAISNVIVHFSKRYMHLEHGYRRFFLILLLFVTGMTIICIAGDFLLLFAGWEIVGVSSYLLIAFYWHRPQAVSNADRAYYIYRFCDLGLLGSALIAAVIWHDHQIFHQHWQTVPLIEQWALCLVILLPVLGKSAQFPFSYWLPRAMEGPTPSSAIFYGALSVHAGVFLLLRTYPIWHGTPGFIWVVGGVGLVTAFIASLSSRVQSNMKGQIGYSSISHVGFMLIELALGFPKIALVHLVFNACLRSFQLLISSSIQADHLHTYHALNGKSWQGRNPVSKTLYVFALNEGYLEAITLKLVKPFQFLLNYYGSLNQVVFCELVIAFLFWPFPSWTYILGVLASWLLAFEGLAYVKKHEKITFGRFPFAASLILLGYLGVLGFPLSVTFIGEDLLTNQALQRGIWFLILFNLVFVINGIALIRAYSKMFFGKRDEEPVPQVDLTPWQASIRLAGYVLVNLILWIIL